MQTGELQVLREEANSHVVAGDLIKAQLALGRLWRKNPTPAQASFILSQFEKLAGEVVPVQCQVAVLRSFTVEPLIPVLRAAAAVNGIDLNVQAGDFNSHAQEILDFQSRLYRFEPNLVILAVQTRDVAPELWTGTTDLSPKNRASVAARVVQDYRSWVQTFRARSAAHLIIHNLEMPSQAAAGVLDVQDGEGQLATIQGINAALRGVAAESTGVYVLDYDGLVARHGRDRWHDEQKWLTMRMPIAADCLVHLVNEWLRFIHPLAGKICKALVTDLDNTLWGGVIGEDGMTGIKVGLEYPGAGYQALQRAMLDLYHRGILLAICSKNNAADAMEVLERHSGMLLRPQHFAAMRINWNDKAQGLREIAAELNIGTDAVAFLDDNPVERERIRAEMPEVTVIELPTDSIGYARSLRECPVFERLALSPEDRERSRLYAEQRQRVDLQHNVASLEDFYCSLAQKVEIAPLTRGTLARIAQLTRKTNQFNLTTHRYSEQEIADLAANSDWRVVGVRVRDRFGDNGLVGVVITHYVGETCEIETFLLSCRVIGRTVETAMLAYLVNEAKTRGANRVQGWFLPTKKNAPAEDFYAKHGFERQQVTNGAALWVIPANAAKTACPDWINLTVIGEVQ